MVGAYLHIPFCNRKCDYCHFYVHPNKQKLHRAFVDAVKKEIAWRQIKAPLSTLYFGGGTPSLLAPELIAELMIDAGEATLEANPESITRGRMAAYAQAGINRVSIGVQTLDDQLLESIGREHTAAQAIEAVYATAEAGIDNISVDLIIDLPGQTLKSVRNTLRQIAKLPITHLSLYNLVIEPPSLFYNKRKTIKLPDDDTSLAMLEETIAAAEAMGLARYEISAFGRPSQHNISYWKGLPVYGVGPSAFAYIDGKRTRNVANLKEYMRRVNAGEDPTDYVDDLSEEARARELLVVGLRLIEGIESDISLEGLEGLVEREGKQIYLTDKGRLFYDTVAERLI